jgi:hypothetical protein
MDWRTKRISGSRKPDIALYCRPAKLFTPVRFWLGAFRSGKRDLAFWSALRSLFRPPPHPGLRPVVVVDYLDVKLAQNWVTATFIGSVFQVA